MFFNLNAEMGRAKLTIKKLSEITAINYDSLKLKLRGVTEFKLSEMMGHCKSNSPGLSYVLLEKQKICKVRKLFLTVL